MKTNKEFRSMSKAEVVAYAQELEKTLENDITNELIDKNIELSKNLELTQSEAAQMSETIRLKNSEKAVIAGAVANLINGLNLAIDNASSMLESIGVIHGGRK